jgi:hypothetical protein
VPIRRRRAEPHYQPPAATVRPDLDLVAPGFPCDWRLASGLVTRVNSVTSPVQLPFFRLRVPLPDVVSMQTCQPNLEGAGEIPLRRPVIEALRMRPSRIVVGEVRQEECLDLTQLA